MAKKLSKNPPKHLPKHKLETTRSRRPTTSGSRHALVGPALITALLSATALAALPDTASALTGPEHEVQKAADLGLTSLTGVPTTDRSASTASSPTPVEPTPQRIVSGVRLKAKPKPWILPVTGYHLTGRFGQSSGLWATTHTGLDFAAPEGTPIHSIGPGVVTEVGSDGAYGNKTVVRLDDGTVLWYCHQSRFGVKVGQRVGIGDLIGYVGSTGNTTGPHLHLEVHPHGGDAIDPEKWLPTHGLHP